MTTPLARLLAERIRTDGPLTVAAWMEQCLAHPEYGYYRRKDPLGASGDFTTAPEISQMFGEMIGLWLADIWARAGSRARVHYVELGPGRGTLARDALRAAAKFGLFPQVHLIEGSPALRSEQAKRTPEAIWHDDLSTVPTDAPILLVANEFLDALPVRQLVRTIDGWRERMVGIAGDAWSGGEDGGKLFVPLAGRQPMDGAVPEDLREAAVGTIIETSPAAATVLYEVGHRLTRQDGAALFIDYGHAAPRTGSTLQAVRAHEKVDPFAAPGQADLTAHVDFAMMARIAQSCGARWLGTARQGDWLRALGIEHRARALAAAAPDHAEAAAAALHRLTSPDEMGDLFKVMGLAGPSWPDGAGF